MKGFRVSGGCTRVKQVQQCGKLAFCQENSALFGSKQVVFGIFTLYKDKERVSRGFDVQLYIPLLALTPPKSLFYWNLKH